MVLRPQIAARWVLGRMWVLKVAAPFLDAHVIPLDLVESFASFDEVDDVVAEGPTHPKYTRAVEVARKDGRILRTRKDGRRFCIFVSFAFVFFIKNYKSSHMRRSSGDMFMSCILYNLYSSSLASVI